METLPKHPDPTVLASISDQGYNPHEIHKSLSNRKFRLRWLACQGVSSTIYFIQQQILYPRYVLSSYISKELENIIQLLTLNPIKRSCVEHIMGAPEAQPG
jgi:uncharacterized membrane protein